MAGGEHVPAGARGAISRIAAGVVCLLSALACAPAFAADPKSAAKSEGLLPQVPGDDIFGFTSPSDIGNPGDNGFVNENDGRFGKRDGRYNALNTKYEFSRTLTADWWIAGSFFGAYNKSKNVTGLDDVNHLKFDGMSFEVANKIISRSQTNPFSVTLSLEPRWGRVDGTSGFNSNSYGATLKLFTDAVIAPDKLFWAGNIQLTSQTQQDPMTAGQWLPSSQAQFSTALTWQASPQLFLGAEARYFTDFDSAMLAHPVGRALYVGPTLLWKANDNVAFNVTYQPQVWGRSSASPNLHLDLDNFERAQFRLKLTVIY